ncbi:MAG: hypothetical protein JKY43_09140 [Phycisphaerales bacterium]|nr:hypothetical protein [Phycisphaerales bacterium]
MTQTRILLLIVCSVWMVLVVSGLAGCSAGSKYKPTGNPILDVRNPNLLERDRVAAAEKAWDEVVAGVRVRERTRQAFKNLAWSSATSSDLRYTTLDLLMSDTSPEGDADSARMARLILPTEVDRQAVRIILQHAIRAKWQGLMPAIVRSYARVAPGYPDEERMERKAIEALVPGVPLETVVFEVFLDPLKGASNREERSILRVADRTRDDAWGLLARLDKDGSKRKALLESDIDLSTSDTGTRQTLADLQVLWNDFGILPDQAMELSWLRQLRRSSDEKWAGNNVIWWEEARSVVSGLDGRQREGLELRHLEAVRWARANHPEWLTMSRVGLVELLGDRLSERRHIKRKADKGDLPRRERLGDWESELFWGDLVTILVVDESIRSESVIEKLYIQRRLDKKDSKTEYGGILDVDPKTDFHRAILFRPRARDRVSDERFVASEDMFRFSDRALAHYHFHANERNNEKYAGPSHADFVNAETSGRTSVVITSLKDDELNVDLYQPNGVVIDLGIIRPISD